MTTRHDPRITEGHLRRRAIVYVRQSDPGQVRSHQESTRQQLNLKDKAIAYGWPEPDVITDDLGVSATGYAERPGFQRVLSHVVLREAGIIFCLDASRLSRNSKDWAHLFELCGPLDTLVCDAEQVYDLRRPNDRLVLGIRGTIAELEVGTLLMRMQTARDNKAKRGELTFAVPIGYTHDDLGRIIVDPDQRIQQSLRSVFERFHHMSSVRQLGLWYRDTATPIARRHGKVVRWEVPRSGALRRILQHPIYAGAYVFGRRRTRVRCANGRLMKRKVKEFDADKWTVCIRDNHEAYIDWSEYEANQAKIAAARPRWKMEQNQGAIRDGLALLSGLLRCGHCGRKLYVSYNGSQNKASYYCRGNKSVGSGRCLSFGAGSIDTRVGQELCRAISPLGIESAKAALEKHHQACAQRTEEARLRYQAAQYEAERALEQFDRVDPRNRLVADTLESRLNARLVEVSEAREHLEAQKTQEPELSAEQLNVLSALGSDFEKAWGHPKSPVSLRKKILRAAIEEIIVMHQRDAQRLQATIHWKGGAHTEVHLKRPSRRPGIAADQDLLDSVKKLVRARLDDAQMARVLNLNDISTPSGLWWTKDRVTAFRRHHKIRLCTEPCEETLSAKQAASYLGISRNGLDALVSRGVIKRLQPMKHAPCRISRSNLDASDVQALVKTLKRTGHLPKTPYCVDNQAKLFPMDSTTDQAGAL